MHHLLEQYGKPSSVLINNRHAGSSNLEPFLSSQRILELLSWDTHDSFIVYQITFYSTIWLALLRRWIHRSYCPRDSSASCSLESPTISPIHRLFTSMALSWLKITHCSYFTGLTTSFLPLGELIFDSFQTVDWVQPLLWALNPRVKVSGLSLPMK